MNLQNDHVLHSRNGKFEQDTSLASDVSRILRNAQEKSPASGLVIHFHGGLVSLKQARGIADFLAPKYTEAGAYPLFFVWESGFIETLQNNLADILKDPVFRELVKKSSEWVLKKLGGQVGLRGGPGQTVNEDQLRKDFDLWFDGTSKQPPVTNESKVVPTPSMRGAAITDEDELAEEISAGFDGDPDFEDSILKLYNAVAGSTAATKGVGTREVTNILLVDDKALNEMFPGTTATTRGVVDWLFIAKFVAKIVIKVIQRYSKGRAHGMYCTIVEEVLRATYMDKVGTIVWNQMKKDTMDSFGTASTCCGTAVISELYNQAAQKPFTKITLVGHSTGAIYICHFLDAIAKVAPELKFDIIFLAPALRHEQFATTLATHSNRIGKFRMFGMSDSLESKDALVSIVYIRSLLYFVSGILEGNLEDGIWKDNVDAPIVGMQRYISDQSIFNSTDFPYIEQIRQFLQGIPDSVIWSESSAGNGLNSMSHKHGDFDNDDDTVKSIAWMISQ